MLLCLLDLLIWALGLLQARRGSLMAVGGAPSPMHAAAMLPHEFATDTGGKQLQPVLSLLSFLVLH